MLIHILVLAVLVGLTSSSTAEAESLSANRVRQGNALKTVRTASKGHNRQVMNIIHVEDRYCNVRGEVQCPVCSRSLLL